MIVRIISERSSEEYSWDIERPEQFQDLMQRYDVRLAKRIISQASHTVELLSLVKYREFFNDLLADTKLREDINRAKVDTELPVIFGQKDGKKFLLDGSHRIAQALRSGLEWLPAITLTSEETAQVRII